jgi:hypothetical protein
VLDLINQTAPERFLSLGARARKNATVTTGSKATGVGASIGTDTGLVIFNIH